MIRLPPAARRDSRESRPPEDVQSFEARFGIELDQRPPGAPVRLAQAYVLALTLLPARLVIGPLGAFGSPASLVGLVAFGIWMSAVARPGALVASVPVRIAYIGLWLPSLISYGLMHLRGGVPGDEVNAADRWFLFLLGWTGVALLAAEGIRRIEDCLRILRVAIAGVAVSSAIALVQSYAGFDLTVWMAKLPIFEVAGELDSVLARGGLRRPAGTASHPIEFGCILALTVGLAATLALADRPRSRRPMWFATALIALAIPLTISRSAIIGATVATAAWARAASSKERRLGLVSILGVLVVAFMTSPGLLGTILGYFLDVGTDTSISTRTSDYAAIEPFVRAHPVFGRGPATFLPKYRILDNQWLAMLVESGVVGVVGFAIFLGTLVWLGVRIRSRTSNPLLRKLGTSLAGCGVLALLMAAFFDMFAYPLVPGYLAILFGVAGAFYTCAGNHPSAGAGRIPRMDS